MAIFGGIVTGSMLHYWGWKKRLMIEEMCIKEELADRSKIEKAMRKLKAGQDIENVMVMNYLNNESAIQLSRLD